MAFPRSVVHAPRTGTPRRPRSLLPMKSESSLWDYLRDLLPPEIHYSRIESETSPGFPDVHYTLSGVTGTIELKSVDRPKAKYPLAGKHGLRKSQRDWIEAEVKAGGFVLLCLEIKPEICILQANSSLIHEIPRMTLADIQRFAEISWTRRSTLGPGLRGVLVNKP